MDELTSMEILSQSLPPQRQISSQGSRGLDSDAGFSCDGVCHIDERFVRWNTWRRAALGQKK